MATNVGRGRLPPPSDHGAGQVAASSKSPKGRQHKRNNGDGEAEDVGGGGGDDDNNAIELFEQEESETLQIHVSSSSSPSNSPARSNHSDNDGRQPELHVLELRQYNSHDTRWGIYSSVWDGGLALAAYVVQEAPKQRSITDKNEDYWSRTVVIDLGSGTGIVGLACAVASRGRAAVHLTDVPAALSLLRDNVSRNAHHWKYGKHPQPPLVHPLVWGEPVSDDWIAEILSQIQAGKRRRVLILGADIVYRVSLFVPLLSTVTELTSKLVQQHPKLDVECLLGCSSTRTHLNTFWKTARLRQGVALEWKASVQLPRSLRLDEATTMASSDPQMPPEDAPVGPGLVSIVALRKLPFTFSI